MVMPVSRCMAVCQTAGMRLLVVGQGGGPTVVVAVNVIVVVVVVVVVRIRVSCGARPS
jgi:hypothetical protein